MAAPTRHDESVSEQTRPTRWPALKKWVLGTGLRVLVFGALVVAGGAWADWDAARADPGSGVNILLGLVVFAAHLYDSGRGVVAYTS